MSKCIRRQWPSERPYVQSIMYLLMNGQSAPVTVKDILFDGLEGSGITIFGLTDRLAELLWDYSE